MYIDILYCQLNKTLSIYIKCSSFHNVISLYKVYVRLNEVIAKPVTSQSHARTWRLSLKHIQRDEDETEDCPQRGPYVENSLSPHQRKGASIVQDVKQTGTAIAECPTQNHRCQNLKGMKSDGITFVGTSYQSYRLQFRL